ncbi:MAG: cell division protein FtsQ/DivIB [Pseudomonadota bacterium]|nr:cell division protein FtsQ/DivIB [Pseudomonadota bacterium]MEC9078307.1 cell division protein FtsQ/DivIB [Pseudomonadota bacterium]
MRLLTHNDEEQSVKQRHPKGLLRKIITKLLAPVIFVLAVGSIVLISPHTGWVEKGKVLILSNIIKASVQLGFVVDDISLIGRINTRKSDIIEAIKVVQGQSILEIDPKKIHSKIENLPWVEFAVVQRKLPNKLVVTITEREPIAIWQKNANLSIIDRKGHLIQVSNLFPFRKLPILVGDDAPTRASKLLNLLTTEPAISAEVVGATWIGGRRWNVNLKGGIEIQLPETNPDQAWRLLARINKKYTLLSRDINVIDLRLPDRIIVKMGPHGRQIIKQAGKNT